MKVKAKFGGGPSHVSYKRLCISRRFQLGFQRVNLHRLTVLLSFKLSRSWSTYISLTVSPTVTLPSSGSSNPRTILNRVVLPAPLVGGGGKFRHVFAAVF